MKKLKLATAASLMSLLVGSAAALPSYAQISWGDWNGQSNVGSASPKIASSSTGGSSSGGSSTTTTTTSTPAVVVPLTQPLTSQANPAKKTRTPTTVGVLSGVICQGSGLPSQCSATPPVPGTDCGEASESAYFINFATNLMLQLQLATGSATCAYVAAKIDKDGNDTPLGVPVNTTNSWQITVLGDGTNLTAVTYIKTPTDNIGFYVIGGTTSTSTSWTDPSTKVQYTATTLAFAGTPGVVPVHSTLNYVYLYTASSSSPLIYASSAIVNGRHTAVGTGSVTDCRLIGQGQADQCLPSSCAALTCP